MTLFIACIKPSHLLLDGREFPFAEVGLDRVQRGDEARVGTTLCIDKPGMGRSESARSCSHQQPHHQIERQRGANLITNSFQTLPRSLKKLIFVIDQSGFIPWVIIHPGQGNLPVRDDYSLDLERSSLAGQGCPDLSQDSEKEPKGE